MTPDDVAADVASRSRTWDEYQKWNGIVISAGHPAHQGVNSVNRCSAQIKPRQDAVGNQMNGARGPGRGLLVSLNRPHALVTRLQTERVEGANCGTRNRRIKIRSSPTIRPVRVCVPKGQRRRTGSSGNTHFDANQYALPVRTAVVVASREGR